MYTLLIPISNLQNRSSTSLQNSYMAHLEEMENPRESQGKSTKSSLASFIFDINFNIQVHWWWVCCRFTCFICGKILEQGVKVTKIRQHLDYAPTPVRKPIIPILTASNLLQTYEWFVQNLVHCLADPWPQFFFDPPNAWDALNFREKNSLCQRNLWFNGFTSGPESKVFFWDLVGIARANQKKVPKSRYETNVLLFSGSGCTMFLGEDDKSV